MPMSATLATSRQKLKNSDDLDASRNFRLAVREIITQSISRSASLEDLPEPSHPAAAPSATLTGTNNYLSVRGRGLSFIPQDLLHKRIEHSDSTYPLQPQISQNRSKLASAVCSYIPQEILDQPLRRPRKTSHFDILDDTESPPEKLIPFSQFFTNEPIDDIRIYRTMEKVVVRDLREPDEFVEMMAYLSKKAMDSATNAPAICKYLYVFSTDPKIGDHIRSAFFGNLEKNFNNRAELGQTEGSTRYRNFIRWFMAGVHHFRHPRYAPFDELLLSLLSLADDVSGFEDSEDIPLFCILILRYSYYSTLPRTPGQPLGQNDTAVKRARDIVRAKLMGGNLTACQTGWLTLVLEATMPKKFFDGEIASHFSKILPEFSLVDPRSLYIRLPKNHGREKQLQHIKNYLLIE
ncbi:Hypothetical protein NTJ_10506 [Nesidiocoris tenuis]|uniref:HECT domain-containing protein n=1 Tax=Nesidiocoris tenuis TaxID=355587 RepID=A0ABN7AZU8_9HEMI|nr:Hypothetical protein NTJ_10506 [Nesidiocoris tenuis]